LQHKLALPGSAKKRRVGRPKLSEKKLLTPPLTSANIDPPLSGDTRREASPLATAIAASRRTEYQVGYDTSNIAINAQAPLPPSPAAIEPAIMGQHADRARRDTVDSLNGSGLHLNHSLSISHNGMVGASQTPGLFPNYYDQFSDSPGSARQDEFTNWLFDDLQNFYSGINHIGLQSQIGVADQADDVYATPFPHPMDSFTMPALSRQPSMRYEQQLAPLGENSWLSEARWRQLIDFIRLLFNENGNPRGQFDRSSILGGDLEAEDHVLNLRLMNAYIATYWQSYHEQMPILHKPTFSADEAPELLILAVMMIGAAHLPTSMGEYIKDNAHQFATFVAWHIMIFIHPLSCGCFKH
jgi:Fungal specific transcription factor domain